MDPEEGQVSSSKRFRWPLVILAVIILIGLIGWGSYSWLKNKKSVSTPTMSRVRAT